MKAEVCLNKKKIAYFNCTGVVPHIGCLAVTDSHVTELLRSGYDLFKVYTTYDTRFLRTDSRERSLQIALLSELKSVIENADAVVINGEGSIHHRGGQDLLVIAELSQLLHTPVFLVNAIIQEVEGYDDVLKKLDDLTVREVNSFNYLQSKGVDCRIVLDSIIDANFSNIASHSYGGQFVCTDWQAQRDIDVGTTVIDFLDTQSGLDVSFMPLSHWSYMQQAGWKSAVENFRNIDFLLTGRHHAVYMAGLAGEKFVAMPSNTFKIEGTIACSGLPIPICDNPKDLVRSIQFSRSNPTIFKEFQSYLIQNKNLSTFDKLRSSIHSVPVNNINAEYECIFSGLTNKALERELSSSLGEAKNRIKNKIIYSKKVSSDKRIRDLNKVIEGLKQSESQVIPLPSNGFKKKAHEFMAVGQHQAAVDLLHSNLDGNSNDHETLYILGLAYIYAGNVLEGLKLLDHRSHIRGFYPKTSFYPATPVWNGEITDEKVLIWSSGGPGLGSEMFFFSMISAIIEKQKNHLIACDNRLLIPLKRTFPKGRFCGYNDIGENGRKLIKYQCSVFSLPKLFFKINGVKELSTGSSYLSADNEDRLELRRQYKENSDLLVGISWFTPNKKSSFFRSIPDDHVLKLTSLNRSRFVSLQHDFDGLSLFGNPKIFFDQMVNPIADVDRLINQISAMDYVVTIDNTVAFLAGALGVPTYLLLSKSGNWPWEVCKRYEKFLPSIRIMQQDSSGDWSHVIQSVYDELERLAN